MKIEFAPPNQVRITWPTYSAAIEAQIIERLKTVPGIEGRGRRWYAPAIQVARLIELFPKSSIGYDALRASDRLAEAFCAMLVSLGVFLELNDSGAIVGLGDGVSPLIQQLIDERAHALRPLVAAGHGAKPATSLPAVDVDRGIELIAKGIQNAQKAAADEVKYPRRRRKVKQGRLGV